LVAGFNISDGIRSLTVSVSSTLTHVEFRTNLSNVGLCRLCLEIFLRSSYQKIVTLKLMEELEVI